MFLRNLLALSSPTRHYQIFHWYFFVLVKVIVRFGGLCIKRDGRIG